MMHRRTRLRDTLRRRVNRSTSPDAAASPSTAASAATRRRGTRPPTLLPTRIPPSRRRRRRRRPPTLRTAASCSPPRSSSPRLSAAAGGPSTTLFSSAAIRRRRRRGCRGSSRSPVVDARAPIDATETTARCAGRRSLDTTPNRRSLGGRAASSTPSSRARRGRRLPGRKSRSRRRERRGRWIHRRRERRVLHSHPPRCRCVGSRSSRRASRSCRTKNPPRRRPPATSTPSYCSAGTSTSDVDDDANACVSSRSAAGRDSGSLCRHSSTNSLASGERNDGISGSSIVLAILYNTCTCPLQWIHGGFPVAISSTVHPTAHTSASEP